MRFNPKNIKFMAVSRSRTIAPVYGDLTIGGAELEEVKGLRILGVTRDSKLTFAIHMREVVSKAARSWTMWQSGKLPDCPRVLMSCFNAYAMSSLEYCATVWMPS